MGSFFHYDPAFGNLQADARDGRPCTFPGRLLLHPGAKDNKHVWSNSTLVKTGRTADADMLHARDMVQVEDVSADALPSTVDDDNAVVQGAAKYQQARFYVPCNFSPGFCDVLFVGEKMMLISTYLISKNGLERWRCSRSSVQLTHDAVFRPLCVRLVLLQPPKCWTQCWMA